MDPTSKQIHLYLFGAPRLEVNGKPAALDTRKALALVAYLVQGDAGPGGVYSRDTLATLLYPESDQSKARGGLRRTLSALRRTLDDSVLSVDRERIGLHIDKLWVDVLEFRQKLDQSRRHPHPPEETCPACLPLLSDAAALYRDGFMAGFSLRDSAAFDDWQFLQSETLRGELAEALDKLSAGLAAQGDFEAAAQEARRWLALDPLREEAHRRLMSVYAWGDRRSAALRQYRTCVRTLDQELGVPPLDETTQLYQSILENQPPPPPQLAPAPGTAPEGKSAALRAEPLAQLKTAPPNNDSPAGGLPFVGRVRERQVLLEAHAASAQKGFIVTLEGEAGIGKSRLAEEFMAEVGAAGAQTIAARCYEGETGLSYAPFQNLLRAALASQSAQQALQSLPPAMISPAGQLLPALHTLLPDLPDAPPPDSPGAQLRFFDALRLILETILNGKPARGQARSPGVLFLDDLQWADAASLELLAYLARRLEGALLLFAWRAGAAPEGHPLRQLIAQNEREGRAVRLHLDRLEAGEVRDLLAALHNIPELPAEWIDQLYHETEGSPFFLVEYLAGLLKKDSALAGTAEPGSPTWEMPSNVRSLLQTRLFNVSGLDRQLLGAAAVLGRTFDFAILREISGRSEVETITGLESLLGRGLIAEKAAAETDAVPPRYDFTHDKLRALVYDEISLARRRLLHQRAGEALSGQGRGGAETASLAAHHFRLAGQYDRAGAAYQEAGAFARRLYANREAIAHFQNALACGHPDPAALHEAIADLQVLLGEYQNARASYEAAAAQCPLEHLPRIEHKLGNVHHHLGDWELAECHFQTALEELESLKAGQARPGEKARLYSDWSRTAYRRGEVAQARGLAGKALELAETSQEPEALAQAHNILGILERVSGCAESSLAHLERSLEIAESLDDPGPKAAALNNLARLHAQNKHLDKAVELTEQALEVCQACNDRHRAAALHNNLADLFHALGNQDRAMQHLRQAVVIFAEIGGGAVGSAPGQPSDHRQPEPRPEIWKLSEW